MAFNKSIEAFIVYINSLIAKMTIFLARKIQISLLLLEKVNIPAQYLNFANMYLKKLAKVLPKYNKINKYAIKLEKNQQLFYVFIYNPGQMELQILKTYIKINLANNFIKLLNLLASASIIFVQKSDYSFCLYVNCPVFNNLIMKN